jgi:transposase-like protein
MSRDQKEGKPSEGPLSVPDLAVKQAPDPEVEPVGHRRRFTAAYKARILAEADACEPGTLGALLRREGLYYNIIQKWRKARADGMLEGLEPRKRGPAPDPDRALKQRNAQLEKENQRLQRRLADAELIIEVQKKLSLLLTRPKETAETDREDEK